MPDQAPAMEPQAHLIRHAGRAPERPGAAARAAATRPAAARRLPLPRLLLASPLRPLLLCTRTHMHDRPQPTSTAHFVAEPCFLACSSPIQNPDESAKPSPAAARAAAMARSAANSGVSSPAGAAAGPPRAATSSQALASSGGTLASTSSHASS